MNRNLLQRNMRHLGRKEVHIKQKQNNLNLKALMGALYIFPGSGGRGWLWDYVFWWVMRLFLMAGRAWERFLLGKLGARDVDKLGRGWFGFGDESWTEIGKSWRKKHQEVNYEEDWSFASCCQLIDVLNFQLKIQLLFWDWGSFVFHFEWRSCIEYYSTVLVEVLIERSIDWVFKCQKTANNYQTAHWEIKAEVSISPRYCWNRSQVKVLREPVLCRYITIQLDGLIS
jgi:hypothetical protein